MLKLFNSFMLIEKGKKEEKEWKDYFIIDQVAIL